MGLFSAVFGKKNAAMMCCFDIAKPIIEMSFQNALNLGKYRSLIKPEEISYIAIMSAMQYVHFYMHLFNRMYRTEYGQQKLSKAQEILFQVIAHEFLKQFPDYFDGDNSKFNAKFFSSFNTMDRLLFDCIGVFPEDSPMAPNDTLVPVFSKAFSKSIFNSSDKALIADIMSNTKEGVISLVDVFSSSHVQGKFQKLASLV